MKDTDIIIEEGSVGLLYADGVFERVLEPGRHGLRKRLFDKTERTVRLVDVRQRSLVIKGQEILTADKVAVRVSLLVYFQVTDPAAALKHVASYEDRIYEDVQLAARRFLASRKLDDILRDRNEISDAVRQEVHGSATGYGVKIVRADVKDLVFPGNLRQIMNQVLETERRAEAKLIQARKDAEAVRVQVESETCMARLRVEAEREQSRLEAEVLTDRLRSRLQTDIEEARAVLENPALLELRRLRALAEMARHGAKFVVGLDRDGLAVAERRD